MSIGFRLPVHYNSAVSKLHIYTCMCGMPFYKPPSKTSKYCSVACRLKVVRVQYHCLQCGVQFVRKRSEPNVKYCSIPCRALAQRDAWNVPKYKCLTCHGEFQAAPHRHKRYCSRECFLKGGRDNYFEPSRRYIQYTCKRCSKSFQHKASVPRIYCSKHCQWMARRIHGPSDHYDRSQWRKMARQIRKRDNYQCQICHKIHDPHSGLLHVDHQIPLRLGGLDSPENLWTLCKSCHSKKDHALRVSGRMF